MRLSTLSYNFFILIILHYLYVLILHFLIFLPFILFLPVSFLLFSSIRSLVPPHSLSPESFRLFLSSCILSLRAPLSLSVSHNLHDFFSSSIQYLLTFHSFPSLNLAIVFSFCSLLFSCKYLGILSVLHLLYSSLFYFFLFSPLCPIFLPRTCICF